jgi:hypothetical protein
MKIKESKYSNESMDRFQNEDSDNKEWKENMNKM